MNSLNLAMPLKTSSSIENIAMATVAASKDLKDILLRWDPSFTQMSQLPNS